MEESKGDDPRDRDPAAFHYCIYIDKLYIFLYHYTNFRTCAFSFYYQETKAFKALSGETLVPTIRMDFCKLTPPHANNKTKTSQHFLGLPSPESKAVWGSPEPNVLILQQYARRP
jgi:hypothetical protein